MQISQIFRSTIGKKLLLGITGLSWVGFAIGHFVGNTTLLLADPTPFNKYAHFLTSLGGALYLIEAILTISLLVHFYFAIKVTWENHKARPVKYAVTKTAGRESRKGIATSTMIWTGILLIIFLVLHINNFKYGTVYMTTIDGEQIRDLYKTVYEYYASPLNTIYYVIMMTLLGSHLSHGVWSAFQSLGLNGRRFTPLMTKIGLLTAVIVSIGFIIIPIYIHFAGGSV
jgi:succinate dehydrogenase / fumarate reductase cytochrome b subunit